MFVTIRNAVTMELYFIEYEWLIAEQIFEKHAANQSVKSPVQADTKMVSQSANIGAFKLTNVVQMKL